MGDLVVAVVKGSRSVWWCVLKCSVARLLIDAVDDGMRGHDR